jgi:hypothetical protein
MKSFFNLAILFFSLSSAASSYVELRETDTYVSLISDAKITSVQTFVYPDCPENALCLPQGIVKLELYLNGCIDRLGPFSYKLKQNLETEKYDLYISGVNIAHKDSPRVFCIQRPIAYKEIKLPGGMVTEDNLNLVILK